MLSIKSIHKILVIEDDLSLNHLLQIKLQNMGFETEGFESGEDAISRILSDADALLLIDYHLGDMLAIEVINVLKDNNIDIL